MLALTYSDASRVLASIEFQHKQSIPPNKLYDEVRCELRVAARSRVLERKREGDRPKLCGGKCWERSNTATARLQLYTVVEDKQMKSKLCPRVGIHLIICPSDKIEWGSTPFPTPSFVSLMLIDIID
jgi:hypothetical protein